MTAWIVSERYKGLLEKSWSAYAHLYKRKDIAEAYLKLESFKNPDSLFVIIQVELPDDTGE